MWQWLLDKRKYEFKSQNRNESGHTGFRMMFHEALGFYRGEQRDRAGHPSSPRQLCFLALVGIYLK